MHDPVGESSESRVRRRTGAPRRASGSTDPYRLLFQQLPQPALTLRLIDGSQDAVVLDANHALTQLTGGRSVAGRTLREALPELAGVRLDLLAQIDDGGGTRLGDPLTLDGRRYALHAFAAGTADARMLTVMLDPLPATPSRDAFKVRLQDALRSLADPVAIQERAGALLGEYLGANRVCYAEALDRGQCMQIHRDHAHPLPRIGGCVRLDDFGGFVKDDLHAGITVVLHDSATDPRTDAVQRAAFARIGVRGAIGVPLLKHGRLAAMVSVYQATERRWTADEVALVEEVAERTWDAVQRAHAEAKLRVAEERYLALFNAIDQGFCTIEVAFDAGGHATDYRFLETSPSFERQSGIRNAAGRWMRDIVPAHDDQWFEVYGRVATTGEPVRFESTSTPLRRCWSVYAFRIGAPELRRVAVLFNDVTPRKRAEQALTNHAAQVQTLIDRAPIGVLMIDADFRVRNANPIALRTVGGAVDGLEGRDLRDVVRAQWDDDVADEIVRLFTRTLDTGQPYVDGEWTRRRRDRGVVEHYAWRIDRITQPDGRYGVVCYFRDVSDDLRARQRLAASRHETDRQRRLYEAILDNTPDLAYVFDLDHRFVYANRILLQLWGRTWDDAIGKTCLELGYEPWHAEMHERELDHVVATQQPIRGEVPFEGTFGRRIYDYIFVPVLNANGEVEAVAGTTRDVTGYRATEQQLDAARRTAEAASHAKDMFLAMLSHELRTPLTPVLMTLAMLERRSDLPAPLAREIGVMRRNVEVEVRLIDDLLDVSRVLTDKLRLQRERIAWHQAVHDACVTCAPVFVDKGIRLHCDVPDAIGDVHADRVRLQQVLWNILRNAAKFTPAGQDVYVTAGRDDANAWICVRDTGIGIRPDVLPSIFETFEQGETAITRQFGGMGLGLSISKSLIDLHGGTLTAASDGPGSGSTFTVTMPLARPVAIAHDDAHGAPGAQCPALRILSVEDHPDTSAALVRVLELRGHRVATAHTIDAALVELERTPFDLLISDIGLPDGTGYDLMRRVRTHYAIKGIAVSGYGMDEDVRRSREAGFSAHVLKPVDIGQLERTIAEVIGSQG